MGDTGTNSGRRVLRTIDRGIDRATYYFSWISVIAIIVMALLAVVDVILSKVFQSSILWQKEMIEELMIPVFGCFIAHIHLTGGLMKVDIFSRKYSLVGMKILDTATSLIGGAIMAYCGYRTFVLFQQHLARGTLATNTLSSFRIWPFTLVLAICFFTLSFAYFWTLVRIFALPDILYADRADFKKKGGEN